MPSAALLLDHAQIARRIPHAGRMCVLHAVTIWDAQRIVCSATSHRLADHPLRSRADARLGIAAGIEYAAQAMAVHGSLLAERARPDAGGGAGKPAAGFLASARGVRMHVRWLDDIASELRIEAQRIASDAAAVLYRFELRADSDARLLIEGRASVMLDDGEAGRGGTSFAR